MQVGKPKFYYLCTPKTCRLKLRVYSILLLICFVAPLATSYFVLQWQKKQLKKEIKRKIIAGINREELVLLKFTEFQKQTQLRWEHSKEFAYQGQMYDIVETQTVADTTYYWVWWDNKETQLNKQLEHLVARALNNNPAHKEKQNQLYRFFTSLFFAEPAPQNAFTTWETVCPYYFTTKRYAAAANAPPSPPPQIS